MRAATFLLLAVVALTFFACAKTQPTATGTAPANVNGDAIETSFDNGFPQDTTTDTTSDTLDTDLSAVSS